MWASVAGDESIANLLVNSGADVNRSTEWFVTSRALARQFNQPSIERWLFRHGAELDGGPSNQIKQQIDALERCVNIARTETANAQAGPTMFTHATRSTAPHRYFAAFGVKRVILPVIHAESQDQALRNVKIAIDCQADGAFLINHAISSEQLFEIASVALKAYPDFWLGINALGLSPRRIFEQIPEGIRGVWVDNAMVDERNLQQPAAEEIIAARELRGWNGIYFGGVAFKYQRAVKDVEKAAHMAGCYVDVVTTSGPGTGQAAEEAKITHMSNALGSVPLAIASGITLDNIGTYLSSASCFLVATGISLSFSELDKDLVAPLVRAVHAYEPLGIYYDAYLPR